MSDSPASTLLQDAIDIPIWLQSDASGPLQQRTQRDREIARQIDAANETARVRRWWRQIEDHDDALPGRSLVRARTWVSLALALLGLVAGTGLALAAFAYDGTWPVNVVRLLALLVVPQLVLFALSILLIPGRVPGLGLVQETLTAINPGALAATALRQITKRPEARAFGWLSAPTAAQRRFGKWQMLFWSQITAVAFNVAVIVTAIVLIAFTDLAFGWSTTVDVGGAAAARVVEVIAAPWAGLFPEAVPDRTLVERSQFFRLDDPGSLPDSRTLTGWWSFTVLAVVVYGLIPRCALLAAAGWRLRAATHAVLLNDSRVVALLDRMSAPAVESRGAEMQPRPAEARAGAASIAHGGLAGPVSAVVWSQAVRPEQTGDFVRGRLGLAVTEIVEAGTGSLAADRSSLTDLAGAAGAVLVLTPAWEPPLLEFVDFLAALRSAIGPSRSIIVVPVGETLQPITAQERDNWSVAVAKAGDPRAYLEADTR